ncbi:SWI/SNF complex subunit SWI3D-like [Chenopodium quinoa]|uniref:SWI/SNF complex subunit SWI3D-like n=1 Tax=Chenopodium quinoa TaxID=63459 RepID=UPI000B76DD80|nr:SWI/SNF complex subunit SWI3D-like [Chenopodium quinoa]
MEDKPRQEAGSPSPAPSIPATSSAKSGDYPATEPPAPRRRNQKRKSTNTSSSSAPPKRHAREKAAAAAAAASGGFFSLLPPIHNGPLTRARQLSDNNAAIFSALNAMKDETSMAAVNDSAVAEGGEEAKLAKEECEKLQAMIDAEFDEIRTRDSSVHVVPVAAGWFSWTNIHSIEKQTLFSFFNEKVENRTPDIYKEIRNWIMKRFHANPSTNIELKDLSELSVGDLDARQEIMEFLDHWGLINYHPFPQNDPNVDADPNTDADKEDKTDSLIEKLYQFELEQSSPQLVPRANMSAAAAVPSGLFPESIAEELVKQEGPAVEYHCNSCSADCSRKRYHCQKQADFDLCSECYNNGKFGSGMCPSDFILMEPAEASGSTGGKWTDQETLLLLEALELFKENWNEIAEHVATKTKAQCILHFLQMPIEDTFLDCDDTKILALENGEPASTSNELPVPKDNPEPLEGDTGKDNDGPAESISGKDKSEPSSSKPIEDNAEPSGTKTDSIAAQSVSTQKEISNLEDGLSEKVVQGKGDDLIIKALKEAFHVAGCPLTPDDELSFAEAGNSVMALAAFLSQLVEPDLAAASSCISLKTLSQSSPGSQLAARHCFILEDPPDDKKKHIVSESTATEKVDQNASDMVEVESKNDKAIHTKEKSTPLLDESHSEDGQNHKKDANTSDDPQLPPGEQDTCAGSSQSTEKPDEGTPQATEKPDEEMPQAAEKAGEEMPQVAGKSDEEMPQVAEKSDEKSKSVEKPEEKSQLVEKPDEEKSLISEKSAEKPQVMEKPDEEKSQVMEISDEKKSQNMEKSVEEKSQVTEKPDEEKSQVTEKSDEEKSRVTEKPDEEKPQVIEKSVEEKSQITEKPDEEKGIVEEKHDEVTNVEQGGTKSVNEPQNRSLQNEHSLMAPIDQVTSASEVMPPPGSKCESEISKTTEENVQCTDVPKDSDMEPNSVVSDKAEQQEVAGAVPMVEIASEAGEDKMEVDKTRDPISIKTTRKKDDDNIAKLKRAALATLSAAAVKAKLLAKQEEDEIRQLSTILIEKQLRKLEIKLSYFTEMEHAIMRVREQLERSRQKLFNERAQIIASRLGIQSSSSRMLPSSYPMNRMPPGFINSMLRPSMGLGAQRPPMSRPVVTSAPPTTNMPAPAEVVGGSSTQPSAMENPSAVETS